MAQVKVNERKPVKPEIESVVLTLSEDEAQGVLSLIARAGIGGPFGELYNLLSRELSSFTGGYTVTDSSGSDISIINLKKRY